MPSVPLSSTGPLAAVRGVGRRMSRPRRISGLREETNHLGGPILQQVSKLVGCCLLFIAAPGRATASEPGASSWMTIDGLEGVRADVSVALAPDVEAIERRLRRTRRLCKTPST